MQIKHRQSTARLHLGHYSMQFKDTPRQQDHDVRLMLTQDYDWITGTEAGVGQTLLGILRRAAHKQGYFFHSYKSNWVMVKMGLVNPDSWVEYGETVIDNDEVIGRGHDTNLCGVSFSNEYLGDVTVMCSHYPTMGNPGKTPNPNLKHNKTLAARIGDVADAYGRGRALFFYGGDQNINDALYDTFFGEELTSVQDELGTYEKGAHGPIDVIATYDKDRRVEAVSVNSISDAELFHFTDHFPLEAEVDVKLLPGAPVFSFS